MLPITSVTAAAIALLLLALAIKTVMVRLRLKAAFGDAGDPELISASRSHGNLSEHAPIVLIMMALLEYGGLNPTWLTIIAAVFVVGRVSHAIGLHMNSEPGKAPIPRQIGVITTWLVLLVLAGLLFIGTLAV